MGSIVKGVFVADKESLPLVFQFNPSELREYRSVNYNKHEPLGFSHPIYHYKNGNGNEISFTMLVKRNWMVAGIYVPFPAETYANLLLDLTYPIRGKDGTLAAAPPKVKFVFGKYIRNVKVRSVELLKTEFTDKLGLKYAQISLELFEVVGHSHDRINSKKNPASLAAKALKLVTGIRELGLK